MKTVFKKSEQLWKRMGLQLWLKSQHTQGSSGARLRARALEGLVQVQAQMAAVTHHSPPAPSR